jgi:hypothetical protein
LWWWGFEDLQVLEVMDAVRLMILDLDIASYATVSFHSISHSIFPTGQVKVTVVGLGDNNQARGLTGAARAVASGEVYFMIKSNGHCQKMIWIQQLRTVNEKLFLHDRAIFHFSCFTSIQYYWKSGTIIDKFPKSTNE